MALPLSAQAAGPVAYDFVDPKTAVIATITEAFGVNNSGWVMGSYCNDGDPVGSTCAGFNPSHGYVMSPSGTFTKIDFPGAFETEVTGMNIHGLLVGLYDPTRVLVGDQGFAFFCHFHFTTPVGCPQYFKWAFPGAGSTDFSAVNDLGDVAGVFSNALPPIVDHGFLLDRTGKICTIDVPLPFAADTNALGINNRGDVVGSYSDERPSGPGHVRAFVLIGAEVPNERITGRDEPTKVKACLGTYITFEYPETGGGSPNPLTPVTQTEAAGINDAGKIVGNYLDGDNVSHAFSTTNPKNPATFFTIDFPQTPPIGFSVDNAATSINNAGKIVGNFEYCPGCTDPNLIKERAFHNP